jgi:uncharacterized protein involved in exopolysaccharide biosynthesis
MNEVSIFEAFEIAWRRKLLIVVVVAVAAAAGYFISEVQPSIYQAETTLVFPGLGPGSPIPGLSALLPSLGRMPNLPGVLETGDVSTAFIQPLLKSRTLAERVVQRCELRQVYETDSLQGATQMLKRNTNVSQDPNTGAFLLAVKAKKPELAAEIANCYVTELQVLAEQKVDLSMIRRSQSFVEGQLARVTSKLTQAENRLGDFQERHQIVALPDEARAAVQHVADLEKERTMARIQLQDTNARLREIQRQIDAQTSQPLEDLPAHSPVIQAFREKLVTLNAELALAKQEFTDENPTVQSLQAQITETRRQIEQEVARVRRSLGSGLAPELTHYEADRIAAEARAEAAGNALARAQGEFERLPGESIQLARLTRDQQVQEALYSMLTSEREKLRLLAAREGPPFVVLDAAIVPEGRVWPRPELISILAAILGFIVGVTLAFFVDYAERARYARAKRPAYEPTAVPMQEEIPATHASHRA